MKAELKFDLSNEDDKLDFNRCVKSLDMALVLWDIFKDIPSDKVEAIFIKHNIDIDELLN